MVKKHAIAALTHTVILGSALVLAGVGPGDAADGGVAPERRGPVMQGMPPGHQLGNAHAGREVYEFETFGNERQRNASGQVCAVASYREEWISADLLWSRACDRRTFRPWPGLTQS